MSIKPGADREEHYYNPCASIKGGGMFGLGDDISQCSQMHRNYMTFYWGANSDILFSSWPGTLMYVLALVAVFVLAAFLEWMNHGLTVAPRGSRCDTVARLHLTAMHAPRVALAYIVMLAAMSFNVGVLIAAVLGHALGFFLFGSFGMQKISRNGDYPPASSL